MTLIFFLLVLDPWLTAVRISFSKICSINHLSNHFKNIIYFILMWGSGPCFEDTKMSNQKLAFRESGCTDKKVNHNSNVVRLWWYDFGLLETHSGKCLSMPEDIRRCPFSMCPFSVGAETWRLGRTLKMIRFPGVSLPIFLFFFFSLKKASNIHHINTLSCLEGNSQLGFLSFLHLINIY